MRKDHLLHGTLLAAITVSSLWAQSPIFSLFSKEMKESDKRLIEPTSPILGRELVHTLKKSNMHPADTYQKVLNSYINIKNEIALSSAAYFLTLQPELKSFCETGNFKTLNRSKLTEVEHAAIPLEVLTPLHAEYLKNLAAAKNLSEQEMNALANSLADEFQKTRENCGTAISFRKLEDKLGSFCMGLDFCELSKDINSVLSSAEVGFPRIQYSLNGYTRYVYNSLLESENLPFLLQTIYDLEVEWLKLREKNLTDTALFEFVVNEGITKGIHTKEIFLVLAYSMRNMPSLDVEYVKAPEKSLLLEVYFWAFKDIKAKLSKKENKAFVFPDYPSGGLGIYHYLTASLLACESRLAGQSETTAVLMGYLSKLGYKANKLYKAVSKEQYKKEGISYVLDLAKKQGFKTGLDAGEYGGRFGAQSCGRLYNDLNEEFKNKLSLLKANYSIWVVKGYKYISPARGSVTKRRKALLTGESLEKRKEYLEQVDLLTQKFYAKTKRIMFDEN